MARIRLSVTPMSKIDIATDGHCIDELIERVKSKIGDTAGEQLKQTAVEVVQNCVDVYSNTFGFGDVGANATGLVSKSHKGKIADGTTGLIYGKVQSGKTNTTIATLALAQANHFRCFIVLTSDNTWLGKQTADRFANQLEGGPVVFNWEQWRNDPEDFATNQLLDYIQDTGVVLVSTKNVRHLDNLLKVLKSSHASSVPSLIFDDEADNASPNTNEAKQAKKGKGVVPDSTVFEMDTVHQHARMFGYRQELLNVTRLFIPQHILEDFRAIHESDEGMRQPIGDDPHNINIKPVWVGPKLKPTRSNVLNLAEIDAFIPGSHIFPKYPLWKTSDVKENTEILHEILSHYQEDKKYVSPQYIGERVIQASMTNQKN